MSTVTVRPGKVIMPALCVACGAPAGQPTGAAGGPSAWLDASGSTRYGGTILTEKMSFPLCRDCADARTRSARSERYPGDWLPGSLGLIGMAFLVVFFARVFLYERGSEWSELTFASFYVFFVGVVSAVLLDWLLRWWHARTHPPNDDDRHRLALIAQAVRMNPQVGPGAMGGEVVGVDLTFNDETFAREFAALNPRPDVPA